MTTGGLPHDLATAIEDAYGLFERYRFTYVEPCSCCHDIELVDGSRRRLSATPLRELGIDDVAFLKALVARLIATHGVDPGRVYVTGMSNGAMMTLRLACEAGDAFRGYFAVSGNLGVELATRCRAATPERLALAFGTDDPLVPWAGGEVRVLGRYIDFLYGQASTHFRYPRQRFWSMRTMPSSSRL